MKAPLKNILRKISSAALSVSLLFGMALFSETNIVMPETSLSVSAASSGGSFVSNIVTVGVRGRFYTNIQQAIDKINEYRLEACREGIKNPADPSKRLTMNDYHPVRWSSALENAARQRAVENLVRFEHTRPNGTRCWTIDIDEDLAGYEVLARSDKPDMLVGLGYFYDEKIDWIENTGRETGHYTAMINPEVTHVGLGGFYAPGSCSADSSLCGRFAKSDHAMDETFGNATGEVMMPVAVDSQYLSLPYLTESGQTTDTLPLEEEITYEMWSYTNFDGISTKVFYTDQITWSSSNASVATVKNGHITPVSKGTTVITAKSSLGVYASVTLTVTAPKLDIRLDKTSLSIETGNTASLTATVLPKDTKYRTVRWKSSDSTVASVSKGVITAKKAGTATISAIAENGKTAACRVTVTIPPTIVTLSKTKLTLGVKETWQLKATLPPSSTPGITWKTSNNNIVSVSGGYLTAKKAGKATITAVTTNGKTAACTVTVKAAPPAVMLSQQEIITGLGEQTKLSAVLPEGSASASLTWSSSNSKIASVSSVGRITANREGRAEVSVTAYNGKTASCTVRVRKAPTGLSLKETEKTIGAGESCVLQPVLPSGTAAAVIEWSSSNNSIATVSNGTVTGKAAGTVTITAKTYNGYTAVCTVKVKNAPKTLTLSRKSLQSGIGQSIDLTARIPSDSSSSLQWTSSDETVATVTDGRIKIVGIGTAVVTVRTYNGLTESCSIVSSAAPESIALNAKKVILGSGEKTQLKAVLSDNSYSPLTWTSSNSDVVTVQNGQLTAHSEGTAVVTVKTYNGLKALCSVVVRSAPTDISLSKDNLLLGKGETYQLNCILPKDTASYKIIWTTDDTSVVRVSDGFLRTVGVGETTIYAETFNGLRAECIVNVMEKPDEIILSETEELIGLGEKHQITVKFPENCYSTITWESSDENIVTVKDGNITAVAIGEAVITAKTYDGITAECYYCVVSAPESITLSAEKKILGAGESCQLTAVLSENSYSPLTWKTSNSNVVTVQNGQLTAHSEGTAVITVKTYNGLKALCPVVVRSAPTTISINEQAVSMGVGETYQLSAVLPKGTASDKIEWQTDSSRIVTVKNGKLTALREGTAFISASTYNGYVTFCSVTVLSAPTAIRLGESRKEVGLGETYTLSAFLPTNTASATLTWTSGNKTVAAVANGKVTALSEGIAVITVKTFNGMTAKEKIVVKAAPDSITLDSAKKVLGVGENSVLTASLPEGTASGSILWNSSNSNIVTVRNGVLTAHSEGTAVITVKTYNGMKAMCPVVVRSAPTTVSLSKQAVSLHVGETFLISAVLPKTTASETIVWTTTNGSVVTVKDGLLTAISEGEADIIIYTYNGISASCHVTIV